MSIAPLPSIPAHILVVDDDDRLRALLVQFLIQAGFIVSEAANAPEARAHMQALAADLLVLDVMMPGERGTTLAAELRRAGGPPVLLLTAMGSPEDRIEGLEAGADDYLTKPFEPKELVLRIRNILARTRPRAEETRHIRFGAFQFDPASGKLSTHGGPVYLTGSETACLRLLVEADGKPVSRDRLAEYAGESGSGNARSVDVQINRLRKKIETNPGKPVYIQTVRHAGYALIRDM